MKGKHLLFFYIENCDQLLSRCHDANQTQKKSQSLHFLESVSPAFLEQSQCLYYLIRQKA